MIRINEEFREKASEFFEDRTAASGVIDIARRACVVTTEEDLIDVYSALTSAFKVARVKNGFHPGFDTKGSGYRDVKLNLYMSHTEGEWEVVQLVELQIILSPFLKVKKLSHVPYTILRGDFDDNHDD